jgi:hypothetical protein
MLPRNPRERSAIVKGIVIGIVAGACLPDSVNPVFRIRAMIGG